MNRDMYCRDLSTGETIFRLPDAVSAGAMVLETFVNSTRLRIQMQRGANDWIARLKLPVGWCFYRFEVDGRAVWNRTAGKMKTSDGHPCSVAQISNLPKSAIEDTVKTA